MLHAKRKLKKIYQIGLRECWRIVAHRRMIAQFAKQHKAEALQKKAAHSWSDIEKKNGITFKKFLFNAKKRELYFLSDYVAHIQHEQLIRQADALISNKWLLFNQEITCEGSQRWHTDFLAKKEGVNDYIFNQTQYFADIDLPVGADTKLEKDVRVVWELNRLHMLPQLGLAFEKKNNNKYVDYFCTLVSDWRKQNPYLLGVNWLCPMEVGLRAINLICAFDFFKDAVVDERFWQEYICLLYDHMHYLEHMWEYYDGRTSNHYLSDLVGYFYLTWFFSDIPKMHKKHKWVVHEILKEAEKQVRPDGASYEGSTAYHVLVTELLYLFSVLCDQLDIILPHRFMHMLQKMFRFIDACKINEHEIIMIGDNDSGKVLWCGLTSYIIDRMKGSCDQPEIQHFNDFGLSILKNKAMHLSLRHHVYQNRQPSGHFHNDVGTVTLAIGGIPILVDPGSYCYTASSKWRNFFRSARQHNMPYIKDIEPVSFDSLFALQLPPKQSFISDNEKILTTSHRLYDNLGITFRRRMEGGKNAVLLSDYFEESSPNVLDIKLKYNFVFDSNVSLIREKGGWFIFYQDEAICLFKTDLDFESYSTWVSDYYSNKKEAFGLQVELNVRDHKKCDFVFQLV